MIFYASFRIRGRGFSIVLGYFWSGCESLAMFHLVVKVFNVIVLGGVISTFSYLGHEWAKRVFPYPDNSS
jgi:hypothetical protein